MLSLVCTNFDSTGSEFSREYNFHFDPFHITRALNIGNQNWSGQGQFRRDPLPIFSAEGPCEQFWHGQECLLFDFVHPAFPLSTTASPTLQGALKDGFGEAVVACNIILKQDCRELNARVC